VGRRGPQQKKLSVVIKPNIKRPLPPKGMTEPSRIVWKRIVGAYPADHFKPQHMDLLRMYCESAAINKFALKKAFLLEYAEPYWLNLSDKMAGRCQCLGVKLGITVNNTLAARGKAGEAPVAKSKREGLLYGTKNR
jgi:hypothetical protein